MGVASTPFGLGAPPTRAPVLVTRHMRTRGAVVRVATPALTFWEGRAFTDPLWVDRNGRRWLARKDPDTRPVNADMDPEDPPVLRVGVCLERQWYRWQETGERPILTWPHAAVVWVDLPQPIPEQWQPPTVTYAV